VVSDARHPSLEKSIGKVKVNTVSRQHFARVITEMFWLSTRQYLERFVA